ncbi:MAG: hypothetical protein M1480_05115 [Bacteroidetes bacterium]|nr:hypothetical protein [Bacteroidota bacterium]
MKRFYNKKYELLSAYIDNELSEEDVKKLEEELKFSKDLQKKLAELKKLKQITISSINPIQENPFFETRLAATLRIKNPWYLRLKKYSPVFGIIALSIIIMVVLKYNPSLIDKVVEQQKSNITAFYKQNLKPLLFAADLTNEDIFDFAFYHRLPLNYQKKQFLQLGSDKNGNQFFEIKSAGLANNSNHLANFIKGLNLNEKQQKQLDSILTSHVPELQSQVLVNDKNTVAINPNIWNYNKALTADLISFAANVNKNNFQKIIPPDFEKLYNAKAIAQILKDVKSTKSNKYIFFTPDSIFSDQYSFNQDEFNKEMQIWSKEMQKNMQEYSKQFSNFNFRFGEGFAKLKRDSSWDRNFEVFIDSNICRVHIPKVEIPQMNLPDMDGLNINLDSLTNYLRSFSFHFPPHNNGKNYKYFYSDSSKGFHFKAYGFDSTFTFGNPKTDSILKNRFKNFGFRMNPDSLASVFKIFLGDSTNFNHQQDMQKQMKEFERQMEMFQKEMEQMQKELKKNVPQKQTKKSVEI